MLLSQVIWHELEVFNGDSSSVTVTDTVFSLSQLQPGRNYSISVSAVSNNIESYAAPVYQATSKYLNKFLLTNNVVMVTCRCTQS